MTECERCGKSLDECDADPSLMCDADGTALERKGAKT